MFPGMPAVGPKMRLAPELDMISICAFQQISKTTVHLPQIHLTFASSQNISNVQPMCSESENADILASILPAHCSTDSEP